MQFDLSSNPRTLSAYRSLPPEATVEFNALYQREYGIILSDEEATKMSNRLFRLYQIIMAPLPSGGSDDYARR